MPRLFPFLLISLPLLLLLELSDAAPVGLSNTTSNEPTTSAPPTLAPPTWAPPTLAPPTLAPPTLAPPTSAPPTLAPPTSAAPTTTPGVPRQCKKGAKEQSCTATEPICLLTFTLNESEVFTKNFYHPRAFGGCVEPNVVDRCIPDVVVKEWYTCFCDSRSEDLCSTEPTIQKRLLADALSQYQLANPTTTPTTTTPDPNHRFQKGDDPRVACRGSSFCHTKILYANLQPFNRSGLGCVDKLPYEALNDTCRKLEPFDISEPAFECFCMSEVGRACNALDENSNRKRMWEKATGEIMTNVVNKEKEKEREKAKELEEILDREKDKFPYAAVFACFVVLILLLGLGAAIVYYRKGKLDRELRKIARATLPTVLSKCDPRALLDRWLKFDKSDARNVPASQLIPKGGPKKVLGAFSDVPMIAATAVDTELPSKEQMHWNCVDDEKLFIAAQCPSKDIYGLFFMSLVHADVRCIMQLTQNGEIVGDSPCDYFELKKYALPQMKVGNATVDVRVAEVEDKKSYAYRKVVITLKGDESGKSGTYVLHHFHYHDWTDHDIPTERSDIFDVAFRVYKTATHIDERLLVHCRGGIGRTGAFLLVQMLLKLAFQKVELTTESVYALAKSIRYRRHGAIQEQSQLAFALFIVAGVHLQAADATRKDSLDVKEFSMKCDQVVSKESAKEDVEREKKAEAMAKRMQKKAAKQAKKDKEKAEKEMEKATGGAGK